MITGQSINNVNGFELPNKIVCTNNSQIVDCDDLYGDLSNLPFSLDQIFKQPAL